MNHPAPKQPINAVVAGLMIRQLEEWENSVFLSDAELIAGIEVKCAGYIDPNGNGIDWHHRVHLFRTENPDAVPYSVVDGTGTTCYGMRYGFEGHQYLSF